MSFSASDVKNLREKTGVGMMECKKALTETGGDMDKAVDWLREKGLAAAAKKGDRIAAEGLVATATVGNVGVIAEVNSETDFVAKNQDFQDFVTNIANTIAEKNPANVEALLQAQISNGNESVEATLQEKILVIGENIKIRRFNRVEGVNVTYVHGEGRIGVLVNFDTDAKATENAEFVAMGRDIAMQIAAINPQYLNIADIPDDVLEKEKAILTEQMIGEGKPAQIIEKIVGGKLQKFYKENCLIEQAFVKDNDITIKNLLEQKSAELGFNVAINSYTRFERGEGLEKKEDDFAAEVAKMTQ